MMLHFSVRHREQARSHRVVRSLKFPVEASLLAMANVHAPTMLNIGIRPFNEGR